MLHVKKKWDQLAIHFKRVKGINYASHHCGIPVICDLHLRNVGATESSPLVITVYVDGYSDIWEESIDPITPGNEIILERIVLKLDHSKLEGRETKTRTYLELTINETPLYRERINILGFYEWPTGDDPRLRLSLACFVQPGHPNIQLVILDAISRLNQTVGFDSFTHLLKSNQKDKTEYALRAIYETIVDKYQIYYVPPPAYSYEFYSQVIRPPHRIIFQSSERTDFRTKGMGTCIDVSLLFAACLENIHLQPLIIFVMENENNLHAFLGCWRNIDLRFEPMIREHDKLKRLIVEKGDILLLEPTGFTDRWNKKLPYKKAINKAFDYFCPKENFLFALDITAARQTVVPLQFPMNPGVIDIVRRAESLAREDRSSGLETKHLVFSFFFGDLEEEKNIAHMLTGAGIRLENARRIMRSMVKRLPVHLGPSKPIIPHPTVNYRRVLEDARFIANDAGSDFIDSTHLFYAILQSRSERSNLILEKVLENQGTDRMHLESVFNGYFEWTQKIEHTHFEPKKETEADEIKAANDPSTLFLPNLTAKPMEMLTLNLELPSRFKDNREIPRTIFRVGDPVGDHWLICDLIGMGGMGMVFLAMDKATGERVALKTIRDEFLDHKGVLKRFEEEAELWEKISFNRNPYILEVVKVRNVGGRIYISMEYIPPADNDMRGSSLRDWILKYGKFEDESIIQWGMQFCEGMVRAYKKIKCHGDICPENIFIDKRKHVKIADFGLALSAENNQAPACGIGHLPYMAPERFPENGTADEISDIYSFGIVLFELVEGGLPFDADKNQYAGVSDWKKAWEDMHSDQSVPIVRAPFNDILQKCLKKQRSARYKSFQELKEEFSTLCQRFNYTIMLDDSFQMQPSPEELTNKGMNLLELGMYEKALCCFEKVLEVEKEHTTALNGKGYCLLNLDYWDQAGLIFGQILVQNPDDLWALIGKGHSLMKLEKYGQADHWFDRALSIHSRIPALWYHKGRYLMKKGDQKKALECYEQALEMLVSQNRKDEALEIVKQGLEKVPLDIRLQQLHGWILRLKGANEDSLLNSLEILEPLYHESEKDLDSETAGILAGTYKRLWNKDPVKYVDLLQKALDLYYGAWERSNKKNTYVGINAATLSLLVGKPEESRCIAGEIIDLFEKSSSENLPVVGHHFSDYWYRVTRAEAELLLGHLGKARRLYQDAMALYKDKKAYIESSVDQLDLILPRLGLSIAAGDFLELSSDAPKPMRVCFGIAGHKKRLFPKTLELKLKEIIDTIQLSLPTGITYEVMTPLSNDAEMISAGVLVSRYEAYLRIPLSAEADEYFRIFKPEQKFKIYLNMAEEVSVLPTKKPEDARYHAYQYMLEQSHILIAIIDINNPWGKDLNDKILARAREIQMPVILIDINKPHNTTYKRIERIKHLNYLIGEQSMYQPKPIDTSHIELPDDLIELTELLAENAHDTWAEQRMAEGWTWGPERDDQPKKHPDLTPYNDLPASEKEYDRKMAMGTLKAILSMGYKIEKQK